MDVSIDPQGPTLKVTIEVQPEHFNEEGRMWLHQFARLLQEARAVSQYHPKAKNVFPSRQFDQQRTTLLFVRYQEAAFCREFWETQHSKRDQNVSISVTLSHIGKTSWIYQGDAVVPSASSILAQHCVQMVQVCAETRRPTTLPQWVLEKYSHLTEKPRPETMLPLSSWPNKVHRHHVTVAPGDIDMNQHTNQASYVHYVEQAATGGICSGFYKTLGEMKDPFIEKMAMLYLRETVVGDLLEVLSWEDPEQPGKIFFHVLKGSKPVFDCFLQYKEGNPIDGTVSSKL